MTVVYDEEGEDHGKRHDSLRQPNQVWKWEEWEKGLLSDDRVLLFGGKVVTEPRHFADWL